jgi:TonB family protein
MKTSTYFWNTALVLVLGMSASVVVAQSLKTAGNNEISERIYTGLNEPVVADLFEKSDKPAMDVNSVSGYSGSSYSDNNYSFENAGYMIDAVVVKYENKTADNSFNDQGYVIDPVVVTFNEKNVSDASLKNTEFVPSEIIPSTSDGSDVQSTIEQQLEYPEPALAQKIEGEVIIEFTVNTEGNVTDTRILKDIGGNCGLTAAKTVSNLKFKPAVQNGFPVACKMVVPVQFRLL